MTLEEKLRASVEALETEPAPPPANRCPPLRPADHYFRRLSEMHKAELSLERLDRMIAADPRDPTLPYIRKTFVDGLPKLVRDMLRATGVIA